MRRASSGDGCGGGTTTAEAICPGRIEDPFDNGRTDFSTDFFDTDATASSWTTDGKEIEPTVLDSSFFDTGGYCIDLEEDRTARLDDTFSADFFDAGTNIYSQYVNHTTN